MTESPRSVGSPKDPPHSRALPPEYSDDLEYSECSENLKYSEELECSEYLEYLEDLERSAYSEYSEYLEHMEDWEDSSLPRLANFSFAQQSDLIQSCELHQGSHSHLVQSCELRQTSSFKPAPPCDKNGHPPTTSIPTRGPHLVVTKNGPGVPDRPLWPTGGDVTDKTAIHPQPPFQHVALTLLSSKTTQAFPIGHSAPLLNNQTSSNHANFTKAHHWDGQIV